MGQFGTLPGPEPANGNQDKSKWNKRANLDPTKRAMAQLMAMTNTIHESEMAYDEPEIEISEQEKIALREKMDRAAEDFSYFYAKGHVSYFDTYLSFKNAFEAAQNAGVDGLEEYEASIRESLKINIDRAYKSFMEASYIITDPRPENHLLAYNKLEDLVNVALDMEDFPLGNLPERMPKLRKLAYDAYFDEAISDFRDKWKKDAQAIAGVRNAILVMKKAGYDPDVPEDIQPHLDRLERKRARKKRISDQRKKRQRQRRDRRLGL